MLYLTALSENILSYVGNQITTAINAPTWTDKASVFINLSLAAVTLGYVIITYIQLRELRKQRNDSIEQVELLKRQADNSTQQLEELRLQRRELYRPKVSLDLIRERDGIATWLYVTNSGNDTCRNLNVIISPAIVLRRDPHSEDYNQITESIHIYSIAPGVTRELFLGRGAPQGISPDFYFGRFPIDSEYVYTLHWNYEGVYAEFIESCQIEILRTRWRELL